MSENGRLPESDLAPIPGGQLRKDAAAAWLAMRKHIGDHEGVWICPTSPRTAYRPFADQQYFWNLYRSGKGALAAVPGTSNHGWGIAVDLPTEAMQAAVREVGHEFGWGIRGGRLGSDAMTEAWHSMYHTGIYTPPAEPPKPHPYRLMSQRERAARDILIKQRRIAKRHGGWKAVDPSHLRRAAQAKADLRDCAAAIEKAAQESGWEKNHRTERHRYIKKLIGG